MAKFDIFRLSSNGTLVVNIQAEILDDLNTRVVAPLLPIDLSPKPADKLNPIFAIGGKRYVLVTQFMATVKVSEFGEKVGNLSNDNSQVSNAQVSNAIDMLMYGF